MHNILKYFPDITPQQISQFEALRELYSYWNERINVISRKDIDNIYIHHILHSLSIGKVVRFQPHHQILDVGTGGGFPGIPLAILFPESNFMLIDSIGKKIKVVKGISKEIGLNNVNTKQTRAEDHKAKYDFVVSRAVTDLAKFMGWIEKNVVARDNNEPASGILYLKGGNVEEDVKNIPFPVEVIHLKDIFSEDYFTTKLLVYIKIYLLL